jgi:hypothetical protein
MIYLFIYLFTGMLGAKAAKKWCSFRNTCYNKGLLTSAVGTGHYSTDISKYFYTVPI